MKKLLATLLIIISYQAHSQDLVDHIPSDAALVFEINIPSILEALSLSELESSEAGKALLANLSKTLGKEVGSIAELGIDTQQSQYLFLGKQQDQLLVSFLMPLKASNVLEEFIAQNKMEIEENGGVKSVKMDASTQMFWNSRVFNIVTIKPDPYNQTEIIVPSFINKSSRSISSVSGFTRHQNKKAAMGIWLGEFGSFVTEFSQIVDPQAAAALTPDLVNNLYKDYEDFSINLFFEEEETRLESKVTFSEELGQSMKSISKSKFNTNFFRYVDLENCVAYLSNNVSVEKVLEEYPTIVRRQVLPAMGEMGYDQEAELGMELFSTIIDEKAIGELIKGDFLAVLSDLKEKEVPYTTYEYDSSFNRIEVIKTKMEQVPDFIAMASTTEGRVTQLSTALLEKYKLIVKGGSYYKIPSNKDLPFEMYYMVKDDIVFLGTSEEQFRQIANNSFASKVPSSMKKHIKKNQNAIYIGLSNVGKTLFGTNPENPNAKLLSNSPNIYFTSEKIKKTTISGSMVITTPQGHENGLKYVMSVIDGLGK